MYYLFIEVVEERFVVRSKHLFLLFMLVLTACSVQRTFPSDTVQIEDSPVVQIEEFSQPNLNMKVDSNLCLLDEEIVFSFKFVNSDKLLTVATSKKEDYLVCRIGTKDAVELEFPSEKADSWNQFYYSYYLRGGGAENKGLDLDYLSFTIDSLCYEIYHEYAAANEEYSVGFMIIDLGSISENGAADTMTKIQGDNSSILGSLKKLHETKTRESFE